MAAAVSIEVAAQGAKNSATLEFLKGASKRLLIGGRWVPARSGKTFEVINPANEQLIANVSEGDKEDVAEAVKAARKAFDQGPWPRMKPAERAGYLNKWADLIQKNAEQLAELDTLDLGLMIESTRMFAYGAAGGVREAASWINKIFGETAPSGEDLFNFTLREPLGVAGVIIPWNAPAVLASSKPAIALACGNTVVLKPAEQTPLSALRIGELALEAGLPEGVFNVVTGFGPGAGSALANHLDVDAISFTGSVATGQEIYKAGAANMKKLVLELGGKSPDIVFPDADLEAAVPGTAAGIFRSMGQVCSAGSRIFVQRDMCHEFADRFADVAQSLKVGSPWESGTQIGPLVSQAQYDRVTGYIDIGQKEGATIHTGGKERPFDKGYFVKPTVLSNIENRMRVAQEEIFGPVAVLIPFKDENDAVLQGNDTTYGLASGVWTRDVSRAIRVARNIRAGTVWVNCYSERSPSMPFGGYKRSGLNTEGGKHSIDFWTQVKSVFIKV
jgi:aldehyde dehydrogenase (NAD+)